MKNRIRYSANEHVRARFVQLPLFLYEPDFLGMTNDARCLYAFLRDRHDLSMKNGWVDESGNIYIIFSRENMADMLGVSLSTVTRLMKTLAKFNLVEEVRQGLNQPNRIYLLTLENPEYIRKCQIDMSGYVNLTSLDPSNLRPSHTNINQTMTDGLTDSVKSSQFSDNSRYEQYLGFVKENVGYDNLCRELMPLHLPHIEALVETIVWAVMSEEDAPFSIDGRSTPKALVVSIFLKLKAEHLRLALTGLMRYKKPITDKKAFMITTLYNSWLELETHKINEDSVD